VGSVGVSTNEAKVVSSQLTMPLGQKHPLLQEVGAPLLRGLTAPSSQPEAAPHHLGRSGRAFASI
jgi:hypothetical protein